MHQLFIVEVLYFHCLTRVYRKAKNKFSTMTSYDRDMRRKVGFLQNINKDKSEEYKWI